ADQASRYRRLQRFFAHFKIDFNIVSRFLFRLFFVASESCYLTIDRTNWKWGKENINVLMLGIVYKGTAIPICWELLNKRGNSENFCRVQRSYYLALLEMNLIQKLMILSPKKERAVA